MKMIYFHCTRETLVVTDRTGVRWLDCEGDYELARRYWFALGHALRQDTWEQAHVHGYRYAAMEEDGGIVSCAAAWQFSDDCREIAAVSTLPGYRRRGYSKRVVGFITAAILAAGKTATCSTDVANTAMIATAKSVGFQEMPEAEVWWVYPRLPAF